MQEAFSIVPVGKVFSSFHSAFHICLLVAFLAGTSCLKEVNKSIKNVDFSIIQVLTTSLVSPGLQQHARISTTSLRLFKELADDKFNPF